MMFPGSGRSLYVVAYDVTDDDRLVAALRIVRDYATGGQKSAYECFLSQSERVELLHRLEGVLDLADDRIVLVPVDHPTGVRVLGIAPAPSDPSFFLVD